MKEIIRIRVAKLFYALGGLLMPIKTYQRTYEWVGSSFDTEDVTHQGDEWEYAGRAWLPCRASLRALVFAQQLDLDHFDHWALVHIPGDVCHGHECLTCGGHVHAAPADTRVNLNGEV